MLANADLHIHSPFSMAVSGAMHPENLLNACVTKGLHILGTGDALHPAWQKEWEPFFVNETGICVIPTGEVEDEHRVHHLIMAGEFGQFTQLRELLNPHSKSISTNGRPHVYLSGEAIAEAGARGRGLYRPGPCVYSLDGALCVP